MTTDNKLTTGEFLLYQSNDGKIHLDVKLYDETIWLTQSQMSDLFAKDLRTISEHITNIFDEKELAKETTLRNFRRVQQEGQRQIARLIAHYNLEMIIAVGYRVRSQRGTQFRQWATSILKEYLVKGFVLNDERLKNPGGWDYFDELLERIKEIRVSEKRFYQKIRDIYATSIDYDAKTQQAQLFFKAVQNKMLWAIVGKTAAEIIVNRANHKLPNMGLTTWQGTRVRRNDVVIAKNYLAKKEIEELNRIVTMFLDYAEDQAKRRQSMSMKDWEEKLDNFLRFNDREVLNNAGSISHQNAEIIAYENFNEFDMHRINDEKSISEDEYLQELELISAKEHRKSIKNKSPKDESQVTKYDSMHKSKKE